MFARLFLCLSAMLVMGGPAYAQDAPGTAPTDAPAPVVRPVTPVQSIPDDFRLPPGEGETATPAPSPAPQRAEPPLEELVVPPVGEQADSAQDAQPPASIGAPDRAVEPVVRSQPTPRGPAQSAVAETADGGGEAVVQSTDEPPATNSTLSEPSIDVGSPATSAPVEETSNGALWLALIGAAIAAMLGLLFWRRQRGVVSQASETVERPKPAPTGAGDTLQAKPEPSRTIDPSTLVSIKPQRAMASATTTPVQPASLPADAPPASGLVTTNLAAKLKARREAEQRQRQAKNAPGTPARPIVKRSISFDWS